MNAIREFGQENLCARLEHFYFDGHCTRCGVPHPSLLAAAHTHLTTIPQNGVVTLPHTVRDDLGVQTEGDHITFTKVDLNEEAKTVWEYKQMGERYYFPVSAAGRSVRITYLPGSPVNQNADYYRVVYPIDRALLRRVEAGPLGEPDPPALDLTARRKIRLKGQS